MIDTHCHLTDPALAGQLEEVLARAATTGVSRMVTIGTTPPDWQACLDVCRKHGNIRCALGVHPNHCHEVGIEDVRGLRGLQADPCVVAVGEMGLDYHHQWAPKAAQRGFFEAQLQIAAEFKRPVVIHSRQAIDDCLAILKQFPVRAVFHCFTGTPEEAGRILEAGYLIGFTGVVTFKNAPQLRQIAAGAPLDRILVETDAPWLAPEPKRGQKINEPSLVMYTAQAVAAARGMGIEELDLATSDNAARFYGWV